MVHVSCFMNMGKYTITYKNALSVFMQYRLNMGLILVSHAVSLSGLVFLWLSVYASGQQMGGYGLSEIIVYYVLVALLASTIGEGVGMAFEVVEEVNRGEVVHYMLKPFSYLGYRFLSMVGAVTINLAVVVPIIFFGLYIGHTVFTLPEIGISGWLFFGVSLIMGILFEFLVYIIAALSSFWAVRGQNFIYATILVTGLMDGSLIPLDLFPGWAYQVMNVLPFQFLIFIPIQAFFGKIQDPLGLSLLGLLWMLILGLIVWCIWRQGVKKVEGVGR